MATFTQNITNAVRCFGEGPSTKWGQSNPAPYSMVWGTSKWGEGDSVKTTRLMYQLVSNSLDSTSDVYRTFRKYFDLGSFTVSNETDLESLRDGTGLWSYVFVPNTTNAEDRQFASWSEGGGTSISFTCQAASAVSWA